DIDDMRGLLARFAGKRIFFDGVFKGDYSLAIVNRFLAQALIASGVEIVCYTHESDWQTDSRLNAMPDVKRRLLAHYPVGETFDIHVRNT
ncbi:hypothetical protein, partial [Klebsiella aerogenes]|uniref:hypothetical protein n=1 Tax=Klebsiella aerogenes TaxID=548 RepID=UPI0019538C56